MSALVVVPCGAAKLEHAAPARELYTGAQFRLALAAGEALAERLNDASPYHGGVAILSARYGLLRLPRIVSPYDLRMDDPRSIAADQLATQLRHRGVTELHLLTPKAYSARILEAAGRIPATDYLAGSRGLLEQRARLARIRRGEAAA